MELPALIRALEDGTLPPSEFSHRSHVQAGWFYLQHWPLREAAHRFRDSLRAYVRGLGAEEKFHVTLTLAFMHLIHERTRAGESWDAFAARNPELFDDARALMSRHYTADALARGGLAFVEPDCATLP